MIFFQFLRLPLFPSLTDDKIKLIINLVKQFFIESV
jgi:dTDP-4-amino-4,6-dideoxygalactose transaminase